MLFNSQDQERAKSSYDEIVTRFLGLDRLIDPGLDINNIENFLAEIKDEKDGFFLSKNSRMIKKSLVKINMFSAKDKKRLIDAISDHKKYHRSSTTSGPEILKSLDSADNTIEQLLGDDDFLSFVIRSESLGVHLFFHKDGTFKNSLNNAIKKYSSLLGEQNPELYRLHFYLWLDSERNGDIEACLKHATLVKNLMTCILPKNSPKNLLHYGILIKSLIKCRLFNDALSLSKKIPESMFEKQPPELCYHQFRLLTGLTELFATYEKYELVIKYQTMALECLVQVHGIGSEKVKDFAGLLRDNLLELGKQKDALEIEKKYDIKVNR